MTGYATETAKARMIEIDVQNSEAWTQAMTDTGLHMDLVQWQAWCLPYIQENRWHPCPRTYRGWMRRLARMASWHAKRDKKICMVYKFPGLTDMHYCRLWIPIDLDAAAIPAYHKRNWREAESISETEYDEERKKGINHEES
jgi:hypothetical protein